MSDDFGTPEEQDVLGDIVTSSRPRRARAVDEEVRAIANACNKFDDFAFREVRAIPESCKDLIPALPEDATKRQVRSALVPLANKLSSKLWKYDCRARVIDGRVCAGRRPPVQKREPKA